MKPQGITPSVAVLVGRVTLSLAETAAQLALDRWARCIDIARVALEPKP